MFSDTEAWLLNTAEPATSTLARAAARARHGRF